MSFHEFFQFRKLIEVTWSQDNAPAHMSAQALAAIQNAALNYSVTHFAIRICSATNSWLEDQEQ